MIRDIAAWFAIALTAVAALLGFYFYGALGITVQDNQDEFIADLRKQSSWRRWLLRLVGFR